MGLKDDNTIIDDREPVTFANVKQSTLPFTPNELRNRGTKVSKAKFNLDELDTEVQDQISILNRWARYIGLEEVQRRKKELRGQLEEREESAALANQVGAFSITLKYDQPDIDVSTSARFVEHQTIDGPVIRQRLGRGLVEIDIAGVCTTPEANVIDSLTQEDVITLLSDRFEGLVQVSSTSTNPFESGGAIDLDGEFTHEFSMALVEVNL